MCDLTLPCVLVETRTPEGKIIREAQHGQGKIIREAMRRGWWPTILIIMSDQLQVEGEAVL
jgi:hypothetical protein